MDTRITILYVVNSLGIGGAEKVVQTLSNTLSEEYEIVLLCLNQRKKQTKILKIQNTIKIFYYQDIIKINYNLRSFINLAFFTNKYKSAIIPILPIIENFNPDIIHFHTHPKDLIIGKLYRKIDPNIRLVYTDHSSRYAAITLGLKHKLFRRCIRIIYNEFNQVFISENNYTIANKLNIINSKLTNTIIPNGIDSNYYNVKYGKKNINKNLIVTYVSRVVEKKGHFDLIKAISLIQNHNFELFIVGDGNLLNRCKKMSEELNKSVKVKFYGSVNNVKQILEESDIGVFPSYQEGLPLSLLEKMAMSLPVIVSDIPELTSIITHNENGLVYKKGNQKDLKEKLQFLLMNKNERVRIGANARKYVEKYHNQGNYVQGHLAFYHEILEAKNTFHT